MIVCWWTYSIWPKVEYQTSFSIVFSIGRLWLHKHAQNGYARLLWVKNDGWNSRTKDQRKEYVVYNKNIEVTPMAIGNKQGKPII